jgi:hypothetical protein
VFFQKEPLAAGGKGMDELTKEKEKPEIEKEEPPPVLKSWRNLYLLVLGNLLFWIVLFTLFTWMFK